MEDVIEFRSAGEWEQWLSKNHSKSDGVWVRMFKKGSGVPTISYSDAIDAALCYGWITGQSRHYDEKSWLDRFVPRRPRSIWSKLNRERAERLIKEGRMKAEGLRQVEEAKLDGRWQRAYPPPSQAKFPADFVRELRKNKKASAFVKTLNRANMYSVVFRIENARTPEQRKEKIRQIVKMMSKGEKFH